MRKFFFFFCFAATALTIAWTWPSAADVRGTVGGPVESSVQAPVNTPPKQSAPPQVQMKNKTPSSMQGSVRQSAPAQPQNAPPASPPAVRPVQQSRPASPAASQQTPRARQAGYSGNSMSVVFSPRKIAALSAEVTSTVSKITKEFGQTFNPGETLILLDPALYKVNIKQARAARAAAEAELARASKLYSSKAPVKRARAVLSAAEIEYEAKSKLFKSRSASKSQMEKARRDLLVAREDTIIAETGLLPALQTAKKDVAVTEAMIEMAQIELDACNVTAPYKGRVEQVLVNENELVEAGMPLIRIIDDSVLLAKFLVPSSAVTTIKPGMAVNINVNELGTSVTGTVSHVSAVLDPASNTFEVFAEIPNPNGTLKSGMTGRVGN